MTMGEWTTTARRDQEHKHKTIRKRHKHKPIKKIWIIRNERKQKIKNVTKKGKVQQITPTVSGTDRTFAVGVDKGVRRRYSVLFLCLLHFPCISLGPIFSYRKTQYSWNYKQNANIENIGKISAEIKNTLPAKKIFVRIIFACHFNDYMTFY